ncbi:MAG: PAS domain S-box protein [Puia sp.]|nr:PAS domain S-box protein [Puia sp.]
MRHANPSLNILVTEDNPGDFVLLEESLRSTELGIGKIYHAALLSEALSILSTEPVHLVFLDLHLPDSSGIESYTSLSEAAQRIPVILLTGMTDTNTALQALLLGAQDYLIKGEFDGKLLARAIRYSIERKRNLENLRDSEERYRELFNNNPMPMWVFDAETFQFLEVNEAAVHHYGYTYEEFLGRTILSIRPREDAERLRREVATGLLSRDVLKKGVWKHLKKNGDVIFVEIASHNIEYMNRRAVLALANDVTEKIRLEKELHEQRILEQKQITEAVILAQERERTEIGKELHDNVNQILGATSLYINTAMTDDTMRQGLLERSIEFISNAINEIRKISKSLITPGIREIGLIESIEDIIEDVKLAGSMKIEFDKGGFPEESIDDRRKLTIFRIIQEQLNNIIKHAKASEVLIRLGLEGENIRLVVGDNGRGFDTTRHRKGVGITNIISRTELFNGQVDIRSSPGEGCTLTVDLPVAQAGDTMAP